MNAEPAGSPRRNVAAFAIVVGALVAGAFAWQGKEPKVEAVPLSGARDARPSGCLEGGPVDVRNATTRLRLAVFHREPVPPDSLAALEATLRAAGVTVRGGDIDAEPSEPLVLLSSPTPAAFPIPAPDRLQFLGPPLSAADAKAIASPRAVTLIVFLAPTELANDFAITVMRAAVAFEKSAPGLIWDIETRVGQVPVTMATRAADRASLHPEIMRHATLQAVGGERGLRVGTFGLSGLGLPELVVENVRAEEQQDMGLLLLLVAQTLLEQPVLPKDCHLILDARKVANEPMREVFTKASSPDAGEGRVLLIPAVRIETDAKSRHLKLSFDGPIDTVHERHRALLTRVFGRRGS